MEPCRYDMACWRPLCPFRHSGRRAARWIAVWRLLEKQEEELHERIVEQNVDMPVPQITVPVPFQEETVEVIKLFPADRISERIVEQIVDASVPQILEKNVEVVKAGSAAHLAPQDRIPEKICEQIDQQDDQIRRVPTDTVHRQCYCRRACCDTATGPSYSDFVEVCESPAGEVRRGSCGCACDRAHHAHQPGDQACPDPAVTRRQGGRLACE